MIFRSPATTSQSATVIAENAMMADAWSTAAFIMGDDKLATGNFNYEVLLVDNKGIINHGKQK